MVDVSEFCWKCGREKDSFYHDKQKVANAKMLSVNGGLVVHEFVSAVRQSDYDALAKAKPFRSINLAAAAVEAQKFLKVQELEKGLSVLRAENEKLKAEMEKKVEEAYTRGQNNMQEVMNGDI